ncbi:PDGLE domain-containing protein [Sulfurimonas sp.]|uniref:PDGLE domain-containing protein n=1 Tax=Sulfurimonas sp. TaxID=2022749 RepID=UPI002601F796|nr:PDGLE domain-containing protein [Sulfurimonas sp.]
MKRKVYIVLLTMIVLVPLGLITDASAWGEWENEYYKNVLGFVPKGIENAEGMKPLIPDYSIVGVNETIGYYLSAIIGLVLIFFIYFMLMKMLKTKEDNVSV